MRVEVDSKRKITIIQEASCYTFSDDFKGLFAVAIRDTSFENGAYFKLYYGNSCNYSETDYVSDLVYACQKIRDTERKYIKTNTFFDEERVDCDKKFYQLMKVYLRENDTVVTD